MIIRVDRERCTGHARCFSESPELYPLDDVGYAALETLVVPPGREAEAQRGAAACPERAITIE